MSFSRPVSHSVAGVGHTEAREAMGSLSFSQTDDTCPRTRAWGVAGALTWNRTTLVGSRGAGRLLADPWAADVRPPPSTTLLDSLALSTCSLWSGQVQSRAQTGLRPLPAPPARCLPPLPAACTPTFILGGRWMKVSSWAVSRIRWGPRTSCSCWMPNLEVRERARQGRWCQYYPPPPRMAPWTCF